MLDKFRKILSLLLQYLTSASWVAVIMVIIYFYAIVQDQREEYAENNSQRVVFNIKEDKFIVFNKFTDKKTETQNPTANLSKSDVPSNTPIKQVKDNIPKVAFLVVNLGLSESATKMSLSLPPEVSIGISTYAANIPYWENEFMNDGHEVFAELPLEPEDYKTEDRGFLSILSYNTNKQNQDNLNSILKKFAKIVGLYTFGNEIFSSSDKAKVFYKLIKDKSLKLAYGSGSMDADLAKLFKNLGILYTDNPVVIDTEVTEDYINKQLNNLVDIAKKNGKAYAIIRPYPISIRLITNWIDRSRNKGVVNIVKLTDIID